MGFGKGIGCGAQCAKLILFVFNFVFFVCGAALLGVGIWFKVDPNAFNYLKIVQVGQNDQLIQAAIIVLIALGAFIFLVGFLGCCGACKESSCMLMTYAILLTLILILQITAGILAAVFRGKIESFLQKSMQKQVKEEYMKNNNTNDALTKAWNAMQIGMKCCGADSYTDWRNSTYVTKIATNGSLVPLTCCVAKDLKNTNPDTHIPLNKGQCLAAARQSTTPVGTYLNTKGCYPSLLSVLKKYALILIGVAFGLGVVLLAGIIMACCLRSAILADK